MFSHCAQAKIGSRQRHGTSGAEVPGETQSVPVKEKFQEATVWEGVVHVFDLAYNPKATRAYAWSSPIEGSSKRRFFAVLHMGAIDSPQAAVGAAIVAEHRSGTTR